MSYQRLRGTHDIFGADAEAFAKLESLAREVFGRFGFRELRTPILEQKDLFTRALGSSTDVVQKEMYEFEDRSGEKVAMRPEGTAGVVRAYLENAMDKTEGLSKLYYIGAMFRSERPQAGRLRQFHQIGVEALGTDSPLADAEAIHALAEFLTRAGAGGFTLKLNNLGTFEERDGFKDALRKYYKPLVSKLCDDCKARLDKNVFRLLDCKQDACRKLVQGAPKISETLSEASQKHFAFVLEALGAANVKVTLDPYLVRGLDYYTKTVFEISHPKLGAQDALAAGGRYDKLVETFGGAPAGAVGFAVGVERLIMCLNADTEPTDTRRDSLFIATLGEKALLEGFKLVSRLREQGIAAEMDLAPKSLKSQMRYADKQKAARVVVLGDNEIQSGQCKVKDMKSGVETPCTLSGLVKGKFDA